jgi:kynureninase
MSAYFLYHSIGLYPGKAAEMAAAFSGLRRTLGRAGRQPVAEGARPQGGVPRALARLIDAPEGSLTSAENVTTGLFSVMGGLAHRLKGRTVLVGADCFPSLHFLLAGLATGSASASAPCPCARARHGCARRT